MQQKKPENHSQGSFYRSHSGQFKKNQPELQSNSDASTVMNYNIRNSSKDSSGGPVLSQNSYRSQQYSLQSMSSGNQSANIPEQKPPGLDSGSDYKKKEVDPTKGANQHEYLCKSHIPNAGRIKVDNYTIQVVESQSEGKVLKIKPQNKQAPPEGTCIQSNNSRTAKVLNPQCQNCNYMKKKIEQLRQQMKESEKKHELKYSNIQIMLQALMAQKSISGSSKFRKSKNTNQSKKNSRKSQSDNESYQEQQISESQFTDNIGQKLMNNSSMYSERKQNPEYDFKKNKKSQSYQQQKQEFKQKNSKNWDNQFKDRELQKTNSLVNFNQSQIHITKNKLINQRPYLQTKRQTQPIPFIRSRIDYAQNHHDNKQSGKKRQDQMISNEKQDDHQKKCQNQQRFIHSVLTQQVQNNNKKVPQNFGRVCKQKIQNKKYGSDIKIAEIPNTTSILGKQMKKGDNLPAQELKLEKNCFGLFPIKD